jgi:hypothetical protein
MPPRRPLREVTSRRAVTTLIDPPSAPGIKATVVRTTSSRMLSTWSSACGAGQRAQLAGEVVLTGCASEILSWRLALRARVTVAHILTGQ